MPLRRPSAVVPGSPENTAKEDNQEVSAQSVPLGQVSLFSFSNCFPLNPPIKPRKAQWVKNSLQCRRRRFDPWVGNIPWRRKWQPTPVFLPREAHGQRILEGYRPMGHKAHTCIKSLGINDEEKHRICPWAAGLKRGVFNLLHPGYESRRLSSSDCSPRFVCRGLCPRGLTQALGHLAFPDASAFAGEDGGLGELEAVGAAVADAGTPAEVCSFHLPILDRRRLATHDGCQRTNRIQHSRVSTTTQCSNVILHDFYKGANFLIVKLLRKTVNQKNKTFIQCFLINLDQVYKSKVKTFHTMKVE